MNDRLSASSSYAVLARFVQLAGDVDIDYDDDSDEEFLQDDKFAKSSNQVKIRSSVLFSTAQG